MPKIFTSIKKITNIIVSGSSINVQAPVGVGPSIANKTTGTPALPNVISGIAYAFAAFIGLMRGAVGTGLTGVVSGSQAPAIADGVGMTTFADLGKVSLADGAELVQVKYDLVTNWGANASAVSHNAGSVDWATPANAQGLNNGTNATVAGNITAAVNANLDLDYQNSVNKSDLTITAAEIRLYYTLAIGTLTAVTLGFKYDLAGGTPATNIVDKTTAQSFTATPDVYSLPITTWAQVDGFRFRALFVAAAANTTANATLDAAILVVTATKTDIP